jgi:hypothetical protein
LHLRLAGPSVRFVPHPHVCARGNLQALAKRVQGADIVSMRLEREPSGATYAQTVLKENAKAASEPLHPRTIRKLAAGLLVGCSLLLAVDQVTAAAPVVVTGIAASIGPTNATLVGEVNPGDLPFFAWFEYGLTTNYGLQTVTTEVGSGNGSFGVTNTLTGLFPDTAYHFRLAGTNASTFGCGQDQVF